MASFAGRNACNLDLYRIIGQNIRELRREIPVTQLILAQHLGVHNDTLSKLERGEIRAEYGFIKAIAELFEVSTDMLSTPNSYKKLCEHDRYHIYDKLNEKFQSKKKPRSYNRAVKNKS